MYRERLKEIIDIAFKALREKINGGLIVVENEASLQLQLSSIIKTLSELFVYQRDELFSIELEKPVSLPKGKFKKSKSSKAKIDVFLTIENRTTKENWPILRQALQDYFKELKGIFMDDPEAGIMTTFNDLERQVLSSVRQAATK